MSKAAFLLSLSPFAALAAADLDSRPLAAYLPDGAILVLRGYGIARTLEDLEDTPLARVVCEGPLARHLEDSGKLAAVRQWIQFLEAQLGIDMGDMLRTVAGEEVIFGLYPGDDPARPPTAVLMRGPPGAEAEPEIRRVFSGLAAMGELERLPEVLAGDASLHRFRNRQGQELVVASHGAYSLVASSVETARHIVDLVRGSRTDSIAANPRVRNACADLVEDAPLGAFLDARRAVEIIRSRGGEMSRARFLARMLESVDAVAAAVHAGPDGLRGRYRVVLDEEKLPRSVTEWLDAAAGHSVLARYLPENAVIAGMGARVDFAALARAALEEMPEGARSRADQWMQGVEAIALGGGSFLNDFLPALGPDLALFLTDLDRSDTVPGELTLLVNVPNEKGRATLATLLRSVYGLTRFASSPEQAARHTMTEEGDTLVLSTTLKEMAPSVVLTPSALVLSTSLEAARKVKGWLESPPSESLEGTVPPFKGGLVGVNFKALGDWLVAHSGVMAEDRARKEGRPVEEVKREIEMLGATLGLMRQFIARGESRPGAFELSWELSVGE